MVARFGKKMIFGTRALMGAKLEHFGGEFHREIGFGSHALVGSKSRCLGERPASTLFFLVM